MEPIACRDREQSEQQPKLEAAIEKAKAVCERLEAKTVKAAKAADEIIREHPDQTLGVGFGVGLLIGVLAARCRRD